MKTRMSVSALVMLFLAFASPALAAAKGENIVRFGVQYLSPTGDFSFEDEFDPGEGFVVPVAAKVEFDSSFGLDVEWEHMFSDRLGLDISLGYANLDLNLDASGSADIDGTIVEVMLQQEGDASMTPLGFALNFHLGKGETVDFYLGPLVAYVMYGDLQLDDMTGSATVDGDPVPPDLVQEALQGTGGEVGFKSEVGYGALLGADFPLGEGAWGISTQLRYLKTAAEIDEEGGESVDVDPWILQVGARMKF